MNNAERGFSFARRTGRALSRQEEERREMLESLAQTRVQINQAYAGFNGTADPDLIESYVYEINALQSRYNYLLRVIKELDGGAAGTLPAEREGANIL